MDITEKYLMNYLLFYCQVQIPFISVLEFRNQILLVPLEFVVSCKRTLFFLNHHEDK